MTVNEALEALRAAQAAGNGLAELHMEYETDDDRFVQYPAKVVIDGETVIVVTDGEPE